MPYFTSGTSLPAYFWAVGKTDGNNWLVSITTLKRTTRNAEKLQFYFSFSIYIDYDSSGVLLGRVKDWRHYRLVYITMLKRTTTLHWIVEFQWVFYPLSLRIIPPFWAVWRSSDKRGRPISQCPKGHAKEVKILTSRSPCEYVLSLRKQKT